MIHVGAGGVKYPIFIICVIRLLECTSLANTEGQIFVSNVKFCKISHDAKNGWYEKLSLQKLSTFFCDFLNSRLEN